MYVVDPTGEVVQIDGKWIDCPDGGSGDALTDACSQVIPWYLEILHVAALTLTFRMIG